MTAQHCARNLVLDGICEVLDAIGIPAVLLDRQSCVVETSDCAREMLRKELENVGGQTTSASSTEIEFCRIIDLFVNGTLQPRTIAIPRLIGPPIVAHGIPLAGAAAAAFEPACALLLLIDPVRKQLPNEAQLCDAFDLSRMEARVALGIARGDALDETANACGISYESARTLIKSVYRKTGVNRQAALVALVYQIALVPHRF